VLFSNQKIKSITLKESGTIFAEVQETKNYLIQDLLNANAKNDIIYKDFLIKNFN